MTLIKTICRLGSPNSMKNPSQAQTVSYQFHVFWGENSTDICRKNERSGATLARFPAAVRLSACQQSRPHLSTRQVCRERGRPPFYRAGIYWISAKWKGGGMIFIRVDLGMKLREQWILLFHSSAGCCFSYLWGDPLTSVRHCSLSRYNSTVCYLYRNGC